MSFSTFHFPSFKNRLTTAPQLIDLLRPLMVVLVKFGWRGGCPMQDYFGGLKLG